MKAKNYTDKYEDGICIEHLVEGNVKHPESWTKKYDANGHLVEFCKAANPFHNDSFRQTYENGMTVAKTFGCFRKHTNSWTAQYDPMGQIIMFCQSDDPSDPNSWDKRPVVDPAPQANQYVAHFTIFAPIDRLGDNKPKENGILDLKPGSTILGMNQFEPNGPVSIMVLQPFDGKYTERRQFIMKESYTSSGDVKAYIGSFTASDSLYHVFEVEYAV